MSSGIEHYHIEGILERNENGEVLAMEVSVCRHPACIDEKHGSCVIRAIDVEKIIRDEIMTFDRIWKQQMEDMKQEVWEEAYAAALDYLEEQHEVA